MKTDGDGQKSNWCEGRQGRLTFAVEALPDEPPEERSAVVAESRDLIVVHAELVGNIYAETLVGGLGEHNMGKQCINVFP